MRLEIVSQHVGVGFSGPALPGRIEHARDVDDDELLPCGVTLAPGMRIVARVETVEAALELVTCKGCRRELEVLVGRGLIDRKDGRS